MVLPLSGLLADSSFLGGWPSVFYVFGKIEFIYFSTIVEKSGQRLFIVFITNKDNAQKTNTVDPPLSAAIINQTFK